MNHWLKIVSVVELDPQAMLTIRLPILSKTIIHYDDRWMFRPVGLLLPLDWVTCIDYLSANQNFVYNKIQKLTRLPLWQSEVLAHMSKAYVLIGGAFVVCPSVKFQLQIWHKCSLRGPNQVLLLFKWIWNTIWPPWPLIVGHIFYFFSRMASGIYSKLGTNVPYGVPTKCC